MSRCKGEAARGDANGSGEGLCGPSVAQDRHGLVCVKLGQLTGNCQCCGAIMPRARQLPERREEFRREKQKHDAMRQRQAGAIGA